MGKGFSHAVGVTVLNEIEGQSPFGDEGYLVGQPRPYVSRNLSHLFRSFRNPDLSRGWEIIYYLYLVIQYPRRSPYKLLVNIKYYRCIVQIEMSIRA